MQKIAFCIIKKMKNDHKCPALHLAFGKKKIHHTYACKEPGNTERRFWVKFSPIFCSFSANFLPMVPYLPFLHTHVYRLRLFPPIFRLFSAYFRLWYPILIINSSIYPFAVFLPTCLRIPLIFRSFSAYFPPKIWPIFRWSCLAGNPAVSARGKQSCACT